MFEKLNGSPRDNVIVAFVVASRIEIQQVNIPCLPYSWYTFRQMLVTTWRLYLVEQFAEIFDAKLAKLVFPKPI